MLTPEQIQAMNEMTGLKKATTTAVGVGKSRADEIRKLAGATVAPQPEQGLFSRVKNDINQAGAEVQTAISGEGQYAGETPLRRGVEATAAAMGVIPKVAGEALPKPVRTGIEKVGQAAGDVVSWLGDKLGSTEIAQNFVTQHPEAAKALEEAAGIGQGTGSIAGTILTVDQGAKIAQKGVDLAGKGVEATKQGLGNMAKESAVKTQDRAVEAAGKVVQGEIKDVPVAAKTLSQVDTTGVKTYEDLKGSLDSHIEKLAKAQDAELLKNNPDVIPKSELSRYQSVKGIDGKVTSVTDFPIADAIDQLKNYYTKIGDVAGKTQMEQYAQKLDTQGFTLEEMNKIARVHGQDLNAYNANGELASGLSKQAAENTRMGVKETIRQRTVGETSQQIDAQLADAIRTRDLVKDMTEKVNQLSQRVEQRGLIEKIGRALGKTVDMATFGGPKAFIQKLFFPSNVGLKTLNSLDLEAQLQKNLKLIKKLNTLPDKSIPGEILKYVQDPKLGLSLGDVTRDYDTVAKALMSYDTSSPTLNLGKGNKMAAPLSEDAATLADLKAKLETGVLTKEEIATAGRLLQKEGALSSVSTGKSLSLEDVVPNDVMSILDKQAYYTLGRQLPERIYSGWDGIKLGQLIDILSKTGMDEEILREASAKLYKAGYRKLGDKIITESGIK